MNFDNLVEDIDDHRIQDDAYGRSQFEFNLDELKAIILEYIERDRAQGQEPVGFRYRFHDEMPWILEHTRIDFDAQVKIYNFPDAEIYEVFTHAQPTPEQIADSWISVKEILPAPYTEVLIWPKPTDFCMTAEYEKHEDYGIWKYKTYEQWGVSIDTTNPTHWMPLPKAPS